MTMIPVICHTDGFRFRVASVTPNLRCVTCGSDDLDLDDDPAPKWERQEARDAQMFTDDYDDDRPTLAELEAEEAEWEAQGRVESRRRRAQFETDLPMGRVDDYQPETGLLNDTTSVTQKVRCSTCFYEGKIEVSDPTTPLPICDNCGANTLSVAGNTLARRKTKKVAGENVAHKVAEIAQGVLATNPGMTKAFALKVARQTVDRYPKVAGRKVGMVTDVRAWADGFGNWHAAVDQSGVGDDVEAQRAARDAIVDALSQREGSGFDPAAIQVELEQRTSQDGTLTSYYREVIRSTGRKTADISPESAGIKVGDIFSRSWGYDQTNVNFYEVVGLTAASVRLREIGKRPSGDSHVVPVPGLFIGEPFIKRVMTGWQGRPYLNYNSYSGLSLWDGEPEYRTPAGMGH